MGIGVRFPLVRPLIALSLWLVVPAATAQTREDREAIIASLERAIAGEVLHTKYGEGSRLQREVKEAFKRRDAEIVRLAQRAARPILAYASAPVGTVQEPPDIAIESLALLELPRAATYSAEIFYSVDGGPLTHGGTLRGDGPHPTFLKLPAPRREPGFHHLKLRADITYGGAAAYLPQEIRRLADLSYGVYDADRQLPAEVAHFVLAPSRMTAQQLDPNLPEVAFAEWIRRLARTEEDRQQPILWNSAGCARGPREGERPANFGDVCVTASSPFGRIWFRTGRIERSADTARWIAQVPEVIAVQVVASARATEAYSLSELPALLTTDPSNWPAPDVFLSPEDIVVTRTAAAMLDTIVTIHNHGRVDARDVLVTVITTNRNEIHMFDVDIRRGGTTTLKWSERMPASYGAVTVAAKVVSSVFHWWPEQTAEAAKAFRIVNPSLAPPDYLNWVRTWHDTVAGY